MEEGKHEIVKANLGPTSKSQSNKKEKVTNRRLKALFISKNILGYLWDQNSKWQIYHVMRRQNPRGTEVRQLYLYTVFPSGKLFYSTLPLYITKALL